MKCCHRPRISTPSNEDQKAAMTSASVQSTVIAWTYGMLISRSYQRATARRGLIWPRRLGIGLYDALVGGLRAQYAALPAGAPGPPGKRTPHPFPHPAPAD